MPKSVCVCEFLRTFLMLLNFAFLSQKLIDSKEMFLKFWMFSAKSVVSFICDEISHKKLLFVAATSSLRGRILEGFWAEKYHSLSTPKYSFSLRSYLSRSVFIIFHQKKYFTVYFFFLYVHKIIFSSFSPHKEILLDVASLPSYARKM